MNKDNIQNIFIALLAAGLFLLGVGVYAIGNQLISVSDSVKRIEQGLMVQDSKTGVGVTEATTQTSTGPKRQVLTLVEANEQLANLVDVQNRGGFSYTIDFQELVPRYEIIDGLQITFPYDESWGEPGYVLPTYDLIDKLYHFGPMIISELHGAFRSATLSVIPKRTLDEALEDKKYIGRDCSGTETFLPTKTSVPHKEYPGPWFEIQAVRFEGEACEGAWVGYEVEGRTSNFVFISSPESNDELLRWVISRSFDLVGN